MGWLLFMVTVGYKRLVLFCYVMLYVRDHVVIHTFESIYKQNNRHFCL